jgi:glucose-1-phosphate thymidylyltransferase
MQAAVLARGLATRMRRSEPGAALAADQAAAAEAGLKTMMPVGSARPFLDYVLGTLADAGCRRVGLVIGPEHADVRRRYEVDEPPHRLSVDFVEQPEAIGTANAVVCCEAWAGGAPFLVLNADNLYPADVLRRLAALDGPGLPVFVRDELVRSSNIPADRVASFALVDVDRGGRLRRIVEKPGPEAVAAAGPRALVSMNCWRFDAEIFAPCRDVPRSARGEFELPQAVGLAIDRGIEFQAIPAHGPVLDLSQRSDVAEVSRRLEGVDPRP